MTQRAVQLTDPATMRALAHPTRLALLGELRSGGPSTVGRLCTALDEAPGSVSYHLQRLVAIGLVSEAPELATDGRERWWRTEHQLTTVLPAQDRDDPERAAAGTALRKQFARRWAHLHDAYLDGEAALPTRWVAAATQGDRLLHLTADDLAELSADLEQLADRWQARSDAARDAPDRSPDRSGAERVTLLTSAFRTS